MVVTAFATHPYVEKGSKASMSEQPQQQQPSPAFSKVYQPREHLVTIKTKDGPKEYYPAAWRLYELNLRYENANFSSEILFMDLERNFVIVKCRLYLGGDYDLASRKTEAMKQGLLSQLDRLETAAKARCARDLGISTELALDLDEGEEKALLQDGSPIPLPAQMSSATSGTNAHTPLDPAVVKERLNAFYPQAKNVGVCKTEQEFITYLCQLLHLKSFSTKALTSQQLATIERDLNDREQHAA